MFSKLFWTVSCAAVQAQLQILEFNKLLNVFDVHEFHWVFVSKPYNVMFFINCFIYYLMKCNNFNYYLFQWAPSDVTNVRLAL